jgi:poly-gamma-glutamate synthesis protein (capsule biosynthesis protein)
MKQKILICGLVFLIIMVAIGIVFVKSGKPNTGIVSGQKAETVSKKAVSLSVASKEDDTFSLLFFGDAMLDRQIRTVIEKRGASFLIEKMKQFFIAPDGAVFNLEGPVTKNASVSQNTVPGDKGHMSFTFDEEMTKNFLKSTKANAIFLGNNHILNFGKAGLSDTENFLKENSIGYFGDIKGQSEHLQKEIGGERIVFIAFNQFFGGTAQRAMDKIRELKKTNDFVVLYAHWGVEYAREESEQQKAWAHGFVDAGADLVIGSHPHVVQPVEIYKNKAIFYSLGNFVFDQYFSPETTSGLAVEVSAKENALDFNLSSLSLNRDGSTTLTEGKKKDDLLLWLSENSNASSELKNSLKTGYFQLENK